MAIVAVELKITHTDGTVHEAIVNGDGFRQWGAGAQHYADALDLLDAVASELWESA